jgi:thiol:disulfide interchange protein DsbD
MAPLAALDGSAHAPHFARIKTAAQLDAALAANRGKPVLLDFYADWCVSCKEMERRTFAQPEVAARLSGAVLLQADVTASDADDRALLKRFGLFGPPGIILFDKDGQEVADARVIGFQDAPAFLRSLEKFGTAPKTDLLASQGNPVAHGALLH